MKNRMLKHRGFSIAVTVIFIAGVALVNVFAGMLADRFYLKIDLTGTEMYTMSKETKQLLAGLDQDVTFIILAGQADYDSKFKAVHEVLSNYASNSKGHISVKFIDPNLDPTLKNDYPLVKFQTYDLIVDGPRRYTSISYLDLFTWETDESGESRITGFIAEQKLASAILLVQSDTAPKALFTEGHQETEMAELEKVFTSMGYIAEKVNLLTDDIAEDATVIICGSPKRDFMQSELEKIDAYMEKGGNLIFFNDIEPLRLKNVELFLYEWGLAPLDLIVLDGTMKFTNYTEVLAAVNQPDKAFLPGLAAADLKDAIMLNVYARPISLLWPGGEYGFRLTIPLISSYSTSYAKTWDASGKDITTQKESGDEAGPFILAALSRNTSYDSGGNPVYSNLILANISIANDSLLSDYSQYSSLFYNAQFLAYLASDLNPAGAGKVEIPAKKFPGGVMLVDGFKQRTVFVVLIVLIPLFILGAGIFMWRRRKSL